MVGFSEDALVLSPLPLPFCFSIPRHAGDAVTNIRLWVLIIDYKAVYEALKQACIIKQKYFSVLDVALFKCSTFKDFKF